jgi:hypothetical protein
MRPKRAARTSGHGKATTAGAASRRRTIWIAARSTGQRKGVANLAVRFMGVATKPGCTSVTRMPEDARSMRSDSRKTLSAALLA